MVEENSHLDIDDAKYKQAVAEILRRHDEGQPEANITSAVRNFLVLTELVPSDEIVEENPPSDGSRRAVDLTTLDTFVEVKRRVGSQAGFDPNPEYVKQLDDYLEESEQAGRGVRMEILSCRLSSNSQELARHGGLCPSRRSGAFIYLSMIITDISFGELPCFGI